MQNEKKRSHPSAPGSSRQSRPTRKKTAATEKSIPQPERLAKWLDRLQAGDRINTSTRILKVSKVESNGVAKVITFTPARPAGRLTGAIFMGLAALALLLCVAVTACTATVDPTEGRQQPVASLSSLAIMGRAAEPLASSAPAPRYELTGEERDLLERVVTAEAGGEPMEGQMAVAQCILNACEYKGIRPQEAVEVYHYTGSRPEPMEGAVEAVGAVFDDGQTVTEEPILFFYNPDLCRSDWHESQSYVMTICCHRFFKEAPHE